MVPGVPGLELEALARLGERIMNHVYLSQEFRKPDLEMPSTFVANTEKVRFQAQKWAKGS
jgi:hypothetical protein